MSCGGCSRREFLSQSLLSAAALALAACAGTDGISGVTLQAATPISGSSLKVADYPALASVGGVAVVSRSGQPIAIVHETDNSYRALSLICPHEGATVGTSSNGFTCPRHGARFDAYGTWTGGQRTSSMRIVATSYDVATGTLTFV